VRHPGNLYDRPANLFVAGFIGSPAIEGTVEQLRRSDFLTGRHLDDRRSLKDTVRSPSGLVEVRGATAHRLPTERSTDDRERLNDETRLLTANRS
jgi:ABC-type sugar transport system ATPase subunit